MRWQRPLTRLWDYYHARISRDPARIASFLDDAVQWSIDGPVDLLHFCGERRGKQAVIDAIVRLRSRELIVTEIEEVLIEGDRAATFMRVSGSLISTGRTVSYRCAHFSLSATARWSAFAR